jgi:hypothetical protein
MAWNAANPASSAALVSSVIRDNWDAIALAIGTPSTGPITAQGGITVGTTAQLIPRIAVGTFTVDTSSIAQLNAETGTFTLVGATTGDMVFVFPSTALNAGLSLAAAANVTATSTVTVQFINQTSAAIVQTSGLTNRYLFIDVTT